MSDKMIEQIEADRDAGTPGPWQVPDQTWRRNLTVEICDDMLIPCPGSGGAMSYTDTVCTLEWNGTDVWHSNARRIARVPDMEARIRADAEVIKAAEALAEAVTREREMPCQDIDMQLREIQAVDEAVAAFRQAIRARADTDALAARDARVRAEARQVKPLEWWRSDTGDLCCDTLVGRYQIQTGRERYFMMPAISPGWGNRPDGDAVPSWHKSEESAKAAAQDDYERRVLSALIPSSVSEADRPTPFGLSCANCADTDALEAAKAEAREEALSEAAVICNRSYGETIRAVHKAILALIPTDQEEKY